MGKRLLRSLASLLAGGGMLVAGAGSAAEPPLAPPKGGPVPAQAAPAVQPAPAAGPLFSDAASSAPALGCGSGCCGAESYAPEGRVWFGAEYLLWWIRQGHVPPLVTAGANGSNGTLGVNGTTLLVGRDALDPETRSGARFTIGTWLDDAQTCGVEANYFFLGNREVGPTFGGNGLAGSPIIARPFINALTGLPDVQEVNFPGLVAGSVHVSMDSRLQGTELNGIYNLCSSCDYRVDLLGGFRYLQLNEGLAIAENLSIQPGVPVIAGGRFDLTDRFDTRDYFYGGNLGARAEWRCNRLFVDALAKVALGGTHEIVNVSGATAITPAGGVTVVRPGGLLTQATNFGQTSHDGFAVVPEAGLTVGYELTRSIRASVGYTFLYWSDVARPGDQIDRVVNPAALPFNVPGGPLFGPGRPAPHFRESDFWAQGINLGLEFRY